MKFIIGKIKTREIVELESAATVGGVVKLMARFMADENGQSIPPELAEEQLLDLDLDDLMKAQEAFTAAILPNLNRRK